MGYHISIWDGETPRTFDHAHEIWKRVHREARPRVAPTERLCAFVELLEREFPGGVRDGTPWKFAPLLNEVAGRLLDTELRWDAGPAAARICTLAEREGLVFFDPQHLALRAGFLPRWEQ